MVKLPTAEEDVLSAAEAGAKYLKNREDFLRENAPKTLRELDEQALKSVALMERYGPKCESNYELCMGLLRVQYNMCYLMVYDGSVDYQDEINAPER